MNTKNDTFYKFILKIPVFVFCICQILYFSVSISAKLKTVDIENRMYSIYSALNDKYSDSTSLHKADSLAALAKKDNNYAAECMFLSIPVKYYALRDDDELMFAACATLKEAALKDKSDYWYFFACHEEAFYLATHGHYFAAIDLANKMQMDSERLESQYGVYSTYMLMGDIYRVRNEHGLSRDNYMKAYKCLLHELPEINQAEVSLYLCKNFRRYPKNPAEDSIRAKEFVERGLALAEDDYIKALLVSERCLQLMSKKKYPEFFEYYKTNEDIFNRYDFDQEVLQVTYRKEILEKDFDKALQVVDKMPSEYERQVGYYVVNKHKGDYKTALEWLEKASATLNNSRESIQKGDLAEMNAKLSNYELELANQQLEADRTEAVKDRADIIIICLCVICVLIFIALGLLGWLYRKIKNSNVILERKNKELDEARKQAEESDKMKTLFVQHMSHEIRTPLNAIVGFSSLLTTDINSHSEEDLEQFSAIISKNSNYLAMLIDDILTISDLDSAKYQAERTFTSVNEVCVNVIDDVKKYVKKGVHISYKTYLSDSFKVNMDRVAVNQILHKLLFNACKFTEKGSIELSSDTTIDGGLQFTVTDTGCGISKEHKDKIFERYYKVDAFIPGLGLGLNICKTIASKIEGNIYLDTSYTEGARFVLEVPVN